jgi:hypothetical protein
LCTIAPISAAPAIHPESDALTNRTARC